MRGELQVAALANTVMELLPAADCGTGALQPFCRCCAERQMHALEHQISVLLGIRDALHLPFERDRKGCGAAGDGAAGHQWRQHGGSATSASLTEFYTQLANCPSRKPG